MSHLHLRAPRAARGAGAQVLRAHFAKQSPIKLGIASSQRTLLAMTRHFVLEDKHGLEI